MSWSASAEALLLQRTRAQIEALFDDLSAPLVQLFALDHLAQSKPVQAQDVLAVAQRLNSTLRQHGLVLEGQIGEHLPFDPNRHTPLSTETALVAGQPVTLRFPGVSYQGKLLQKAGVASISETR
jgi:molecular chaperone GrpE (heat shock protein)